jgi:hypothetical protein
MLGWPLCSPGPCDVIQTYDYSQLGFFFRQILFTKYRKFSSRPKLLLCSELNSDHLKAVKDLQEPLKSLQCSEVRFQAENCQFLFKLMKGYWLD